MMDLIVDFPSKRRLTSSNQSDDMTLLPTLTTRSEQPKRSVRFSETSFLTMTERVSPDELAHRWYSRHDRAEFGLQRKRDVRAMLRKLENTPVHLLGQHDVYSCVGIELFLSYDILSSTGKRRYEHVSSILEAQSRHKMLRSRFHSCNNNNDAEEELASISRRSSEWIKKRSHNTAAMYWTILKN